MKKSEFVAVIGAAVGVIVLGIAPAASASPLTPVLPPGQTLYSIDCYNAGGQLFSVTPDGSSTPIGPAIPGGNCAGGAQTSPVDGKTYLVYYPAIGTDLATVDLTTGVITTIASFTGATTSAYALVITNSGAAYVSNSTSLYRVDLTTAVTTLVGNMAPFNPGGMAYDSTTDTIYGFDYSNTLKIYTIDRSTGAPTDTGHGGNWPAAVCLEGGSAAGIPNGAVFDSTGIAWLPSDSCRSNVMVWDPINNIAWMTGELFDSTGTVYPTAPSAYYSQTFVIAPVPQVKAALASTGQDYTGLALIGGGAAVVVALGVVLLVVRRRGTAKQ